MKKRMKNTEERQGLTGQYEVDQCISEILAKKRKEQKTYSKKKWLKNLQIMATSQ